MPFQVLSALQHAQLRLNYTFTEQDFLEGKVGAQMKPEDFNFEENVSNIILMSFTCPICCTTQNGLDKSLMPNFR